MMKILSILLLFAFGLKAQELIPYLKDGEYGYSDISGNIMIAPKYDKAMVFDSDGVAYAQFVSTKSYWQKMARSCVGIIKITVPISWQ